MPVSVYSYSYPSLIKRKTFIVNDFKPSNHKNELVDPAHFYLAVLFFFEYSSNNNTEGIATRTIPNV